MMACAGATTFVNGAGAGVTDFGSLLPRAEETGSAVGDVSGVGRSAGFVAVAPGNCCSFAGNDPVENAAVAEGAIWVAARPAELFPDAFSPCCGSFGAAMAESGQSASTAVSRSC